MKSADLTREILMNRVKELNNDGNNIRKQKQRAQANKSETSVTTPSRSIGSLTDKEWEGIERKHSARELFD